MEREVRYATAEDGVRIAYCVEGKGPPLLFVHYVYSFSMAHFVPKFDDTIRRIGRGRRLIRYDQRGTGLSQREVDDLSPAAAIWDMEAVVRDLSLERFAIMGVTLGGLRAIEYTARHPDQVAALLLFNAFPRLLDVFPREMLQALAQLCRANWQLAARTLTDAGARGEDEREGLRWADVLQNSITGETMARLTEAQMEFDVSHLLGRIECPTLISQSREDPQYRFALGEGLAAAIPTAELAPLDGDVGRPVFSSQSVIDNMEAFLRRSMPAAGEEPGATRRTGSLSVREIEILRLIAAGQTSKEISRQLSLSIRTVGRHITNIYDKIGARGRADATAYAHRHGLTEE